MIWFRLSLRLPIALCRGRKSLLGNFLVQSERLCAKLTFSLCGYLIHSDLSGIVRISNSDGFNYFLIFEDDWSRYTFVFLIARKFQTVDCLTQLKEFFRIQFGKEIKSIKSDNGTEYVNIKMYNETTQSGMIHQLTAHGNPENNSRAERPMRTLDDMARALMKQAKLHQYELYSNKKVIWTFFHRYLSREKRTFSKF